MKRTLIAASLIFCSGALLANECNVNINGRMTLDDKLITITTETDDLVTIESNQQLFVNGIEVELSQPEKRWVQDYYDGIYAAVPQAANIAVEGVALASSAISEVFGGFLGKDNQAIETVTTKLAEIGKELHGSFYAEDGRIRVDSMHFSDGDKFGEQWSNEFEAAIEDVISNSVGHLLIAIGTQLMFGDDNSEDFDQRMANFSEDFEKRLDAKANVIEQKANALCYQLANIDLAENQLQSNISALAGLDVFTVKTDKSRM